MPASKRCGERCSSGSAGSLTSTQLLLACAQVLAATSASTLGSDSKPSISALRNTAIEGNTIHLSSPLKSKQTTWFGAPPKQPIGSNA